MVPLEWDSDDDWNVEEINEIESSSKKKITDKDCTDTSSSSPHSCNNINTVL